jgi:branched-chain amino acid transport system permease protein
MSLAVQTFVAQLPIAALYALVGVGFVTIYRTTKVFNLAQGVLALMGGYVFYFVAVTLGAGFWLSIVVALALSALAGLFIYFALLQPLVGSSTLLLLLLTLALNIVLVGAISFVWGAEAVYIEAPEQLAHVLDISTDVSLSYISVGTIVVSATMIAAYEVALRRSRFGAAMRATAENPSLASHRGVNVDAVSAAAWAIAIVFGAIAGISYGLQQGLSPTSAEALGFAAFPAVVLGGIDSVLGALVGAVVVGELQGFAVSYIGGEFAEVAGYLVVLIILVFKPEGLFSRAAVLRL